MVSNYKFSPNRANQKIVVNCFKKFLHDKLAYSLNNPVNYIDKQGNKDIIEKDIPSISEMPFFTIL
ncbi:hypothetical protein [Neobacillus bataviensis]|uniref:hypothetical protein n=1 Tax=Neobacillus bataviensis TaxID=220685 RepID=UPI0037C7ADB8